MVGGTASTSAGSGRQRSEISHVIPLRLFQYFKSERWNSAVFETLTRPSVRELRAELVDGGGAFATVVLVCVGAAPDP